MSSLFNIIFIESSFNICDNYTESIELNGGESTINNQMNNDQINNLILTISRLQVSLNQTQQELNQVRREINNNNQNAPAQPPAAEEREGLRIGDRVRILNGVRISGNIRNSRNVEGTVHRFTGTYVIVRVSIPSTRAGVDRYQDVRRAFHNVERLSRISE